MFFSTTCAAVNFACAAAGSVEKEVSERARENRKVLRNIDGSLLVGTRGRRIPDGIFYHESFLIKREIALHITC
jgi:hypothetical protein